ncbi:MAG: putative 2-aminoethylphosphonate ABC transporter substrate-binding protein [Hyphomicrobiaceae bacterium]|nr:putative 2-aminoethylphosphonate ABC transporter substrate-binding protein [Hyphomicrobiaceae bacterium]
MKSTIRLLAVAALSAAFSVSASAQTKLSIYTALENDQLAPFKAAIEKATGVQVDWVRDSTGVITARFLAEKASPKADMVLGLAASSLLLFEKEGLLETYKPAAAKSLKPAFTDSTEPYTWTGMDAFLSVVCFNKPEGEKRKAALPTSWQDLTKPEFKDQVVMPHPASSGTGYLTIAAWIQIMGEQAAWEYMDKLHQNIAVYTHSGSAPCVQAAKGERMTGIGFDMRGAKEKTSGAPIEIVLPKEGAGWDMEATAIVKGTKNLDAAKKVADWIASKEANELYGKYYAIVAHSDVKAAPANYPTTAEQAMVKNDFAWMAANRERILAEWVKRYESKAQPKK